MKCIYLLVMHKKCEEKLSQLSERSKTIKVLYLII